MIVLDGLALPDDLLWTDEWTASSVTQTVRRTLEGGLIVAYRRLRGGRPITLESSPETGWLTRDLVEALAPRAASPGAIYPLQWRGTTWTVMFRHHEPPAFDATPLLPRVNPSPEDFYRATLKLMTFE
jgi:hypothetical protein